MNLDIVLELEKKIDRLLDRKQELEEECGRLQAESEALRRERERVRDELDRILAKLDQLDRGSP